jgi:hypothetical protein
MALMVEGFIASLNAATATVLGHTPAVPFGGAMETTVGGPARHAVFPVVKVQTKFVAIALANVSWAPVVTVAVYKVFSAREADGEKVAVSLATS